jgi:hypothetical protein
MKDIRRPGGHANRPGDPGAECTPSREGVGRWLGGGLMLGAAEPGNVR